MQFRDRLVFALVWGLLAPVAWAQASKAESAEAEAAMERAKRAAAGPLKAIQQASRIRRRGNEADLPVPVPAGAAITATAAAAVAAERIEPRLVPSPAAPAPAAVSPLASDLEAPSPVPVAEVAPLAAQTRAAVAVSLPAAMPAQPLLDTLPVQPKLVNMVEPAIPQRLLPPGGLALEVQADLTLRPDGGVAAVALVSAVPRVFQRYITAALEQWRFEPLVNTRQHRVVLVFNADAGR